MAREALDLMDVDKLGLDHIDRNILNTMIEKFQGGLLAWTPWLPPSERTPEPSRMWWNPTC